MTDRRGPVPVGKGDTRDRRGPIPVGKGDTRDRQEGTGTCW